MLREAWSAEIRSSQPQPKITSLRLRLIAEPPAHRSNFAQPPKADVEHQPDYPDHQHGSNHQVVTLAGVAGVDHQVAEAGIDSDHFSSHHHYPGDAQRNAQAHQDLGQN